MKYFIDTEFIEGHHKPLFGKRRHFIDLISIGIVAEDGREYYAISNEFNPKDANVWVRENVISKLPPKATSFYDSPRLKENLQLYKNNAMIANDVQGFIYAGGVLSYPILSGNLNEEVNHEFYGYYADYDWVLFCSLFGRMIDLPKGFPMYCRDLKQMFDDKISKSEINAIGYDAAVKRLKQKTGYPKQDNEHNALADAKWNQDLYNFLQTF